jgi:MFS family permease
MAIAQQLGWKSKASKSALLLLLGAGYAVYAADRTVLSSVLKPMASSLAISNAELGLLVSAQYIGVLCVVFAAGTLSDKYGRFSVLLAGLVIFTAFTWLIGFAANFWEAFVFRLVSGFGEGLFWPVAMAAVAEFFGRRKGFALGIFYDGFDLGGAAGLTLGGLAFAFTASWRPAFFLAPTFGFFVIIGMLAWMRYGKREIQFDSSLPNKPAANLYRLHALELLKNRNMVVLATLAFVTTWASVWQVAFLPYYYSTVMHYSILFAALLASVVLIAGLAGKFTIGTISDHFNRKLMIFVILIAVTLSYLLFFSSPTSPALTLIGAVGMGFFTSSLFPVMQSLIADNSKGRIGTGLGIGTTAQSIATVIAPNITTLFFTLGVGRALALDAIIPAALSIVVALFLMETRELPKLRPADLLP